MLWKQVKQPHKHFFYIFILSLRMPRVASFLLCVCVKIFSKKNIVVFLVGHRVAMSSSNNCTCEFAKFDKFSTMLV